MHYSIVALSVAALLSTFLAAGAPNKSASAPELPSSGPKPAPPPKLCQVELSSTVLLPSAHARGIAPASDCYIVDLPSNRFHAPPDSSCVVTFNTDTWLASGWQFVRMAGAGRFVSKAGPSGLQIIIEAGGGFRLHGVLVTSVSPMDVAQCNAVGVEDLLR